MPGMTPKVYQAWHRNDNRLLVRAAAR